MGYCVVGCRVCEKSRSCVDSLYSMSMAWKKNVFWNWDKESLSLTERNCNCSERSHCRWLNEITGAAIMVVVPLIPPKYCRIPTDSFREMHGTTKGSALASGPQLLRLGEGSEYSGVRCRSPNPTRARWV